MVVLLLQMGVPLLEACRQAIMDLPIAPGDVDGSFMSIVAVDNQGNHCGVTNAPKFDEFSYMAPDMCEGKLLHGVVVDTGQQQ